MTNCTRCTEKPIVKNHMCEEWEEELNEWLRPKPELDGDQWYTIYESKA